MATIPSMKKETAEPAANVPTSDSVHMDTSRLARVPARAAVPASKQPANWNIVPNEADDGITATNAVTGEAFAGTIAEFNAMLRGE